MVKAFYHGVRKDGERELYQISVETYSKELYGQIQDAVSKIIHDDYEKYMMIKPPCLDFDNPKTRTCPFLRSSNGQCNLIGNLLCKSHGNCDHCSIRDALSINVETKWSSDMTPQPIDGKTIMNCETKTDSKIDWAKIPIEDIVNMCSEGKTDDEE